MSLLVFTLLMLLLGFVAGVFGSILGLGGGIIITPIITTFFGVDIKYAIGASIVAVIATSSGAAISYLKDDMINVRTAMFLEIFTTMPARYYDAILMDIRMPLMDGIQATQAIRRLTKEDAKRIPIIAMTANAFEEDIENTKRVGMNAHLAKPIESRLLYQTLYHFIYSKKD